MCVVSAIGDGFRDKWPYNPSPGIWPPAIDPNDSTFPPPTKEKMVFINSAPMTKEEWEQLKKEVQELRIILEQAKKFDDKHNEPHCHVDEKVELIKHFAKIFNISFDGIFDREPLKESMAPVFEPFRVVGADGEAGRFADKELANKFADYLTKYNGNEYAVVSVVDDSHLKYLVVNNGVLVAKFATEEEVNNFLVHDNRTLIPESNYRVIVLN